MAERPLIIADEKIPLLAETFGQQAELLTLPANEISNTILKKADLVLVRTVTPVNSELLANTYVRFVGTATAGFDHVDQHYLQNQKIHFAHALGCNANAVAEYVLCCLSSLTVRKFLPEKKLRVGIIGLGYTGSAVAHALQKFNYDIIYNDPPRAVLDKKFVSVSLKEWHDLDLICVHTPLTTDGDFPTHHLINQAFLQQQKKGCVIINAGRGAVIDEKAALNAPHIHFCCDVWENEPDINLEFFNRCLLVTPHIAGYSAEAKLQATKMLYQQAADIFRWPALKFAEIKSPQQNIDLLKEAANIYDPWQHTQQLKMLLNANPEKTAEIFLQERNSYLLRTSFLRQSVIPA